MRNLCLKYTMAGLTCAATAMPIYAQSVSTLAGHPNASLCYQYAKTETRGGTAIRTCTESLSREVLTRRDRAAVFVNRGILNRLAGNYKLAFDDYVAALKLKDDMPEAVGNRGNIYYLSGKFEQAIEDYQKSIEMGISDQRIVRLNTAMALAEMKRNVEARASYRDLMQRYPDWEMAREVYQRFEDRQAGLLSDS